MFRLIPLLFLLVAGCDGCESKEEHWGEAYIRDHCERCPECCTKVSRDGDPETASDLVKPTAGRASAPQKDGG